MTETNPYFFTKECPICKGKMAESNKFCSMKCYKEYQSKKQIEEEAKEG